MTERKATDLPAPSQLDPGVTLEDILTFYRQLWLAMKEVDELNRELSVDLERCKHRSESKVILQEGQIAGLQDALRVLCQEVAMR